MLMNTINTRFILTIIAVVGTGFPFTGLAASIKLINEYSEPITKPITIYFDQNNKLQTADVTGEQDKILQEACNTKSIIYGSPTHKIILRNPRVESQKCLPDQNFPQGFELVLGLNTDDKINWKHFVTQPYYNNENDPRIIIGASEDGVIIHSFNTGLFEIISPKTGEILFPQESSPKIIDKNFGIGTYNSQNQILYKINHHYGSNNESAELIEINLKTGTQLKLAELPKQYFTSIPAIPYSMILSGNRNYLVLISHVGSRIKSYDLLMIYDIHSKQWIYKKKIESPYPSGSQLIGGKDNNFGLMSSSGDGKVLIQHFLIED